jgi:hypothetical protein
MSLITIHVQNLPAARHSMGNTLKLAVYYAVVHPPLRDLLHAGLHYPSIRCQ